MTPSPERNSELREALEQPGCIACRRAGRSDSHFMAAFLHDSYTNAALRDHLRRSAGFCARHTRLLISADEAPWVLSAVYADVVDAVWRLWPSVHAFDPCPMCAASTPAVVALLRHLGRALRAPDIRTAYERNGGLCEDHARHFLVVGDPGASGIVMAVLRDALAAPARGDARLAAPDADVPLRAPHRAALAALGASLRGAEAPLDHVQARLEVPACPGCLARGLAEADVLERLRSSSAVDIERLAEDDAGLCAIHLEDARCDDPSGAPALVALARGRVLREFAAFERARAGVATPDEEPSPARHGSATAPVRRPLWPLAIARRRGRLGRAAHRFATGARCIVCETGRRLERSELSLLVAALHDAPTARRFERSHGLCLRHAGRREAMVDAGADAVLVRQLRDVTGARLAVLRWELAEHRRQETWKAHLESKQTDGGAWHRAPAALDGWVYLGAPPPA